MRFYYILCLQWLLLLPLYANEERNPFMEMISKPYAEYAGELHEYISDLDRVDSLLSLQRLQQIKEAARVSGSLHWDLEAQLFDISYRFREGYRDNPANSYHTEEALQDITDLSVIAKEHGDKIMSLRLMRYIINIHANLLNNYEEAFEYAWRLDEEMRNVSSYEFPDKLHIYREIALMYYKFKDYDEAMIFFGRILEDEQAAIDMNTTQAAYNGIGLIYRNRDNNLDKSDEYFRKILEVRNTGADAVNHYRIWEGIAKGNLGQNQFLRKHYDEASPLLEFSYKRMLEYNDYHHASGSTLSLAELCIQKQNLPQAFEFLKLSRDLIYRSMSKDRMWNFYYLTGKYYSLKGDSEQAILYTDSAIQALNDNNLRFSALKLHRAEQRVNRVEQKLKEEELHIERIRNRNYRTTIIIVSVGLALLIVLLIYSNILYRKRRAAYRQLVHKARQWAMAEPVKVPVKTKQAPLEETDKEVMQKIQRVMEEEKAYLNFNLSLDILADRLNINRSLLSQVINQYTESNFNQFVNDYRVKEAILLFDNDKTLSLSIDTIAYDSGFSNRVSFYRSFKKVTGLSPTEYRNNKE